MPKHKQMPGMTYRILFQDAQQATVEYTYLCPYCMRKSIVQSVVYSPDYERLETGGFLTHFPVVNATKSLMFVFGAQ